MRSSVLFALASACALVACGDNTPPNQSLQVADVSVTTPEDTPISATLDTPSTATLAISTQPTHGSVSGSGPTYTYTPDQDYDGDDQIVVTVTDGTQTVQATVSITVTPVDDAPVAVDDDATDAFNQPLVIDAATLLANDTDVDGPALSVTAVADGTHGTVALAADQVTFTPEADFTGAATFTYTVSDGTLSADATVTVTVTQDFPPIAADDALTTAEDTAGTVDVLANDTDPDGNTLSISAVGTPSHGTTSFVGATVTYTPDANYNGSDSFTYTVSDGEGGTDTGNVAVTVTAVNDAPIAVDDNATTDSSGSATQIDVLANDSDVDGDTLDIIATSTASHGTVTFTASSVSYTPNAAYAHALSTAGSDSFTYTIGDGHGATATATVHVSITPVNHAPVANDDAVTTNEDTTVAVDVLANDSDPDTDGLTVTAVSTPSHGTSSLATGAVTYTPDANYNGSDSFTYTLDDGHGGVATGTVSVTVTPVNDDPVANDDSFTVDEDTAGTVNVLANDTDVDGDTLSIFSFAQASHGTVALAGSDLQYTPDANYNGTDSFTYAISDGHGGGAQATVHVTITPVEDAPVATADSKTTSEDTAADLDVLANDSDVDGDALSISNLTAAAHGTVSVASGKVHYVPSANYSGADSFTYTANDGQQDSNVVTVAITVIAVADQPNLTVADVTGYRNTAIPLSVTSSLNDTDGSESLSVALTPLPLGSRASAGSVRNDVTLVQATAGPTVGSLPVGIAAADLNGDGKMDLVDTNFSSNNISVLLGNGDGTFQTPTNYPTGVQPIEVATGYLDSDLHLDLVVTNSGSNTVSVLLGNGDGTFGTQLPIPVGPAPFGVEVADFNGDQNADLAVTSFNSSTVAIMNGNGTGSFVLASSFSTNPQPRGLVVAKLDGDANYDIAVGVASGVNVYHGNGDSSFTSMGLLTGSAPVFDVTAGDFDGDGSLDLAATDTGANVVSTFRGRGDGSFASQVVYPVGNLPSAIVSTDLDEDGDVDLVLTDRSSNSVGVLLGNGDGTFQAETTTPAGAGAFGLALADFDGDGTLDVATANFSSTNLSILLERGSESVTLTAAQLVGLTLTPPENFVGSFLVTATATATEASNGDQAAISKTFTVTVSPPSGVLLVAADPPYAGDVQAQLTATGSFTRVDVFDATSGTPTLAQLGAYEAVLVWSDFGFQDSTALGNVLADYYDAGGRVVGAVFSNASAGSTAEIGGRFYSGGYSLLLQGNFTAGGDSLGVVAEPGSSLMTGVNTLTSTSAYRGTSGVANGGIVVASWGTGFPLVVRGVVKGRNRVDLNFFPPSVNARSDFWSGDGAILMRNALLYQ